MTVKLPHIMFRFLTATGPDATSPILMHLQHQPFRFLFIIAKELSNDVGDIAHEIHGVIVDDDTPGCISDDACFRFQIWRGYRGHVGRDHTVIFDR